MTNRIQPNRSEGVVNVRRKLKITVVKQVDMMAQITRVIKYVFRVESLICPPDRSIQDLVELSAIRS